MKDKKSIIRVALLANTGLGNEVFKALKNNPNVIIDSIVTRKFESRYPYYNCRDLYELVKESDIKLFYDVDVNTEYYTYLINKEIDLIIVSSFNQIIKEDLIKIPKLGIINFHPSLLPKLRGPNPLTWALLNNENICGVTVHRIINKIDAGNIIKQKAFKIEKEDFLGSLIKKAAKIAGELTNVVINDFINNNITEISQNEKDATYYPRPRGMNSIKPNMDFNAVLNVLRAFHPFPGSFYHEESGDPRRIYDYIIDKQNISEVTNSVSFKGDDCYLKLVLEK